MSNNPSLTLDTSTNQEPDNPLNIDSLPPNSTSLQTKSPKHALEKLTLNDEHERNSASISNPLWNFSTWGASLVSSVTSTAGKIGDSVSKATSTYLDDVYSTLDPEYKTTKPTNSEEKGNSTHTAEKSSAEGQNVKGLESSLAHQASKITKVAGETAEGVMSTIDKTFNFASGLLGNAVVSGYNVISSETSKLSKSLESYREDISTESKSPILSHSREIVNNIATQGVDALEQVGKRAVNILTPTIQKKEDLPNVPAPSNPLPNFSTYFENHGGSAHLSALEMLSGESQLKLTISPLYNNPRFLEFSNKIKGDMTMEEILDELDESREFDLLKIKTEMANSLENLGMHSSLTSIQMNELDEVSKKILKDNSMQDTSPYSVLTTGFEDLSKLTTTLCEQMLRISEIFLLAITDLHNNDSINMNVIVESLRNLIKNYYEILQYFYIQKVPRLESDK
ncbi:hypothetical protein HMI55_006086, partial [Coelomomyces lativittatus]